MPKYPGFPARYELHSTDPSAAEALFDARVVSLLESHPDVLLCAEGSLLLLFREHVLADVEGIETLITFGLRLARLLERT